MEFLEHLAKESENCGIHDVPSNNSIPTDRPQTVDVYPDPFSKLVSGPDFDKIPTGGFLAELTETDTKNESTVTFDMFNDKHLNDESHVKQSNGHSKPEDYDLNSDCAYSLISLFPFVCGVCEKKFDNIPGYFEHLTSHTDVTDLLHCCKQLNSTDTCKETEELYSCGICKIMYPSLCTLYKHMLEVEKVNDFVFKSTDKTVYAHGEKTKSSDKTVYAHREETKSSDKTVYAHREEMDTDTNVRLDEKLEEPFREDNNSLEDEADLKVENNSDTEHSVNESTNCTEPTDHGKLKKSSRKPTKRKKTNRDECLNKTSKKNSKRKKSCDTNPKKSKKDIKLTFDSTLESDNLTDEDQNVEVLAEWNADTDESLDDIKISEPWTVSDVDKQTSCNDLELQKKPTNLKHVLFPCEVCGGFYQHQHLQKHRTTHDEPTVACDQCPVLFKSQFRLNAHKKQVHVDEKKFTCDVCGKSFKAWPYLKQHRQIHLKSRDILCSLCPMKFQYKALLRAHMVTHSDDKPHQCDMCDRTFKRIDRLNWHKRYFHSEERNHSCPKCNKTFKTRDAMNRHHQIHLPPNNFCHICGKGFVQKYNMRIHQKVHGIYSTPMPGEQLL